MMPEPAQSGDANPDTLNQLYTYIAAGFSVIPIDPRILGKRTDRKHPYGELLPLVDGKPSWNPYRLARATRDELQRWAQHDINIAIIGGKISGKGKNLFILDIDDAEFSFWIENHASKLLGRTWTGKTGRGLLHIYMLSDSPVPPKPISIEGRKLMDVRGEGSYVVAPPSLHVSGSRYSTYTNEPNVLALVPDGLAVAYRLCNAFMGTKVQAQSVSSDANYVLPAEDPKVLKPLLKDISRKVYRAIVDGALAREGEWEKCATQSDVDFAIAAELIRKGISDDDIERIFASFPIGQYRYRDSTKSGSYGHSYLTDYTLKNARASVDEADQASRTATGPGWQIVSADLYPYDEPEYALTFQFDDGRKLIARGVRTQDLVSDRLFQTAVGRSIQWFPDLQPGHVGRNFIILGRLIAAMAKPVEIARDATIGGHLRGIVSFILQRDCRDRIPTESGEIGLGWKQDGFIYVRPQQLISRVEAVRRLPNLNEKLWQVIAALRATEMPITVGEHTESM
jgi:hypothetical protein